MMFPNKLPGATLSVLIRDDTPMIHCNDAPSYRSVQVQLTDEQRELLALRATGSTSGNPNLRIHQQVLDGTNMTDHEYSLTMCDNKGITRSPEYLEHIAKVCRVNGDGTRTTVWMGPIDQLGNTLYLAEVLCSYAATAKLKNTTTWMEGMAEHINELLDGLNDSDRVRFLVTEFYVEKPTR